MRPTGHRRNLLWWLAIVVLAFGVFQIGPKPVHRTEPRVAPATETEAFVALRLPRVRDGAARGEITPQRLRELLGALDEAGYSTIAFEDVQAFYEHGTPLPQRPVMIIVPEAWRETVDLVDEVLASLEQRAVLFVDVSEVQRVNLSLISRVRLTQLAESGRWQLGIASCNSGVARIVPPQEQLQGQRVLLEEWLGTPIRAVDCRDGLPDDARKPWEDALRAANLPLGFVRGRPTANFQRATPLRLHAVPVGDDWRAGDVAARLAAYAPRRETFADHFQSTTLDRSWLVDSGAATAKDGALELTGGDKELGLVRLGGTDNWRDVQVETKLASRPRGQFWIYVRRRATSPFVRLGVIGDEILLQRSDEDTTRQLARVRIARANTTLTLRVIGDRAIAFVDGRRIVDRPVELPPSLRYGPVALAVWGEKPGEAMATITSFRAEPLPRLSAVLNPTPTSEQWRALHRDLESLAEVSPTLFHWKAGKGREIGRPDSSLSIFAHYHRLAFRPAVIIEAGPGADDVEHLQRQLVDWAKEPGFDGLNLLVRESEAGPSAAFLAATMAARNDLRAQGKELSLTLLGKGEGPLPPTLLPWRPFRTAQSKSDGSLRIASSS